MKRNSRRLQSRAWTRRESSRSRRVTSPHANAAAASHASAALSLLLLFRRRAIAGGSSGELANRGPPSSLYYGRLVKIY
uniref:Uncharacterized protein n=1 Tax=Oryza punctata TaxID=4537 RepID=A0A0E0LXI3_ORYPU